MSGPAAAAGRQAGSLRLAVIGAGAWAEFAHIPGFLRRAEVVPWVVSRRDPAELERLRSAFGFAHATTDWREAVGMGADIVALTGPGALRGSQALAALEAGSHVLAEKPFTIDPAEAWTVERRARELGRHVVLCYAWNEMGIAGHARRLLADGGVGRVEAVSVEMSTIVRDLLSAGTTYLGDAPVAKPRHDTWADPAISGGGYGQGQLTHALGLVAHLLPHRAVEVAAFTHRADAAVELHDALILRLDDGAIASIGGASLPLGTFGNAHQLTIRVTGSEGQVVLDMAAPRVALARAGGTDEVALSEEDVRWSFDRVTDRIVDLALGRTSQNPSPASLGARVVEILDAMYRSATSGRVEAIARA